MGLFGPSKAELEERIEELEEQVTSAQDRADMAIGKARAAHRRHDDLVDTLSGMLTDCDGVPDQYVDHREGVVDTLAEARVGYKATRNAIVELLFPSGTTIVHPHHRHPGRYQKRRAGQAIVVGMYNPDEVEYYAENSIAGHDRRPEWVDGLDNIELQDTSKRHASFEYRIGDTVEPTGDLNESVETECAQGIHFFRTPHGALDWY